MKKQRTKLAELPVARWKIVRRLAGTDAHVSYLVKCLACRHTRPIFVFSWAGHGATHCRSGKHRLRYRDRKEKAR